MTDHKLLGTAVSWAGNHEVSDNQASFLGYMDAFWVLMLISLAAVPLALALAQGQAGGRRPLGSLTPEDPHAATRPAH